MHDPKRIVPIFLLAALINLAAFPETNRPFFADLASFHILDQSELALIDGGDMILAVDREAQTMDVYSFNLGQLLSGGFETLEKTTVNVTTEVVRDSEATAANPKNAMAETHRDVDINDTESYYPVQLPSGTYVLDYTKPNVAGFGPGIHIAVTVPTPIRDSSSIYQATDFFVHGTNVDNTNGCVGVKNGISIVLNTFKTTGGTKTITIDSYKPITVSSSNEAAVSPPTSSPATKATPKSSKKKSSKPWYKFW